MSCSQPEYSGHKEIFTKELEFSGLLLMLESDHILESKASKVVVFFF